MQSSKRSSLTEEPPQAASLLIVAALVSGVLWLQSGTSRANPYPGPSGAADDQWSNGCWAAGGSVIPQSLFDSWWVNIPALTDITNNWNDPCINASDARFDIRQHPTFPNALGTTACVDAHANGTCDTFDVWVDPDRDAEGYCFQFNTWCHEVGHSLGLADLSGVVNGSCMGAGANACVNPPRTWRYDDHEIGHINTLVP
jgi:hypothetical protein